MSERARARTGPVNNGGAADGLLHIELINQAVYPVVGRSHRRRWGPRSLATFIGNCFMFIMAIANGRLA